LIDFNILRKALVFYLKAKTRFQVKSVFVQQFIQEVIENNRVYYAFGKIITLREKLKQDARMIQHTDYGAGSQLGSREKSVSSFVNTSASSEHKGSMLFNLARYMDAKTILELGTNVGIGTAYLASANSKSQVETIEGCPQLCQVAKEALSGFKINNVHITAGKFSEELKHICAKLKKIDLVFIDGDHSYQGTKNYYAQIKPYLHEKSIVVFDDIYWSDGMTKAWNEIKKKPEVVLNIDVFRLGFIFFDKEIERNELKLVPYRRLLVMVTLYEYSIKILDLQDQTNNYMKHILLITSVLLLSLTSCKWDTTKGALKHGETLKASIESFEKNRKKLSTKLVSTLEEAEESLSAENPDLPEVSKDFEKEWTTIQNRYSKLKRDFEKVGESSDNYFNELNTLSSSITKEELKQDELRKNKELKMTWDKSYREAQVSINKVTSVLESGNDFHMVLVASSIRQKLEQNVNELKVISEQAKALLQDLEMFTQAGRELVEG